MIRLREESYPPPYQIELAKDLAGSDDGLALKALKANPLYPIAKAEFINERKHIQTSYFELPIFYTEQGDKVLKVLYADAPYRAEYKFTKADKYGSAHIDMRIEKDSSGRPVPVYDYDLGDNDPHYHIFFIKDIEFIVKHLSGENYLYTFLFEDIRDERVFITQVYAVKLTI